MKPLRANWQPNVPIELGTVGKLDGEIFKPLGSLKADCNLDIGQTISGATAEHLYFTTSGDCTIKFNAAGAGGAGAVSAKATLQVDFSSSEAVFFNAAACIYESIADKLVLANKILDLKRAGKWDVDLAVVIDYVKADATTIAVSGSANSSIVFEAATNVANINLADAKAGLSLLSSRNIGYQLVASTNLRPLICLGKVQSRWFLPDKWSSALSFNPALSGGRAYTQDKVHFDRIAAADSLYFGTFY